MSYFEEVKLCTLILRRRILKISNHGDVVEIECPRGGIMNIAVADPFRLKVLRNYISWKEHRSFVVASLTGVTTGFSNDANQPCHISVKPFFHSWPRFTAVVKEVCKAEYLFFSTSEGGIVFRTGCPDARRPRVIHEKKKKCAPIENGMLRLHEKSKFMRLSLDICLRIP